MIYDGIIIKSGLRNDIPIARQISRIETTLLAFGNNILYAKSLYDNNFNSEENEAFPNLELLERPCQNGGTLGIPAEVCESIANGNLNRGVFNMFMWEKVAFENSLLRLKSANTSIELL